MSTVVTFQRLQMVNDYDLDHRDNLDGESNRIFLVREIGNSFSGKKFRVIFKGITGCIIFEDELSDSEKATAEQVIMDTRYSP